MRVVKGVLVSEELIDNFFSCDIQACLGICCCEGDAGAPLEASEIAELEENFPIFNKYMTKEGVDIVASNGVYCEDDDGELVTPLLSNEACAYIYVENNIAKCAIEKAYEKGEIDFQKPISCHLYPIRIKKLPDYEALNYHQWHVCKDACIKGKQQNIRVIHFLKKPLIRKYGKEWYAELEKVIKLT